MKERRIEIGMTQGEFASALKTDVPMISRYENYKCLPIPKEMKKVCQVLACDVDDIYDRDEITFGRKAPRRGEEEYKLTVRLPKDAKWLLPKALEFAGYSGVSEWVRDCYGKLLAKEELNH